MIFRKEKKVLQATIVREKRNKTSKAVRSGSSTKDQGWKIKVQIEMIANSRITKRRTKKVVANVSIWKIQQKQELEGEKGGLMNNQQPKSSFSNPKRGKQNRHSATFKREAKRMHKIEEMQTLSYLKIKQQMKRSSKAWKETRWKANDNKKIRIKEGMEMSWGYCKEYNIYLCLMPLIVDRNSICVVFGNSNAIIFWQLHHVISVESVKVLG